MNEITKHLTIIGSEESNWLGVPTLSEIHQYLAKKLRALDLDSIADKSTWDLINLLAKTPAAVNNLMRYFYEPTDEEIILKRKLPSTFHLQLAKSLGTKTGQIIITTNRDRLIEWGLARVGIAPQIISNPNNLIAALPFEQTKCTLIKLNGDYLDWQESQIDHQLKILIDNKIKHIYAPVFCKCAPIDQARLSQFKFRVNE